MNERSRDALILGILIGMFAMSIIDMLLRM